MNTADLVTLFPWFVVLVVFLGMLALCWKAMSALNGQAQALASILADFHGQMAPVPPAAVPAPVPAPVHPPVPVPGPIPPASPVIDQGLLNFVKKEEGFAPKAKWDYKQYTNGYGTKAASSTEVVDEATAEQRLAAELAKAEQLAETVIPANAPKGVKQALTDLTFNAGPGWETQTLGALIKAGNYEEAKSHLMQYNHAGGQVLAGLTARRQAEVEMMDKPL